MKKNDINQLINVILIILVPLTVLNLLIHVKRESSYKLVENDEEFMYESYNSLRYSIQLHKNDQNVDLIIFFDPEVPIVEIFNSDISINNIHPKQLIIDQATGESYYNLNEKILDTLKFNKEYEFVGVGCIFRFENINNNDTIKLKIRKLNLITNDFNYQLNKNVKYYLESRYTVKSLDIHSDFTYLILQYQLIACAILIFLKLLVSFVYYLKGRE